MITSNIQNELDQTKGNAEAEAVSTSSQQGLRNQQSQSSNRSDRRNKQMFQVPSDQVRQSSSIGQNSNQQLQIQSKNNQKSIEKKISLKQQQDGKQLYPQISIKEDVINEASSMCKSMSSKTIQLNNQKIISNDILNNSNKIKVLYGNQVIQLNPNQSQMVEQMNNSMQSFYSKKSKDLQVYSAQDNKMLVLEVKNPENIEKLRNRIEKDEKRKQSVDSYIQNDNLDRIIKENINLNEEQKASEDTDKVLSCKICLEEGNSEKQGNIFTPCQCTGTCKWIHEECLKEWIISRYVHLQSSNNPRDFLKAECEICKYRYNMKFTTQYKFYSNNIFTRLGKKNFITCICSLLCVIAYICCLIFFLVIKSTDSEDDEGQKSTNGSPNNGQQTDPTTQSKGHEMSVQSYEYALIIVCSLLIILSIIVCIISTKQAFFRKSIGQWIIHKYDSLTNKQQTDQILKESNNKNIQRAQTNSSGQDRFHYNGQTFTSDLRNQIVPVNSHINTGTQLNRNLRRREFANSTQDQSIQQNSNIFNLRNSEFMPIQGSQHLMLIQDQRGEVQNKNHNNNISNQISVPNEDILSEQNTKQNEQDNNIDQTEIIRINRNRVPDQNNNLNQNDNYNDIDLSQSQNLEYSVFQFNINNNSNLRQNQSFNYADNY